MSLLDEALAQSERVPKMCDVRAVLTDNPELADEIVAMLKNHKATHEAVSRVLAKRDIHLGSFTISRHRLGNCAGCRKAGYTW